MAASKRSTPTKLVPGEPQAARCAPVQLVPPSVSADTLEALKLLLQEAVRGNLAGLAFVALYRGREYMVDVTGECRRKLTYARGMLRTLDDELADLIRKWKANNG